MSATLATDSHGLIINPLDNVEMLFGENGWPYERMGSEEICATITGQWCEYHLRFFWREEGRILQMACMFDMKVPESKQAAIYETLSRINERVWIGHFETWADEGVLMFRQANMVNEMDEPTGQNMCTDLVETALRECERFYPVFQFVMWAGKTPVEAIEAAMLETMGEA